MITERSSFKELVKAWKKSPANMGIDQSLKFYENLNPFFSENEDIFFKAEMILLRSHLKAFLAWLKLQQ